MRVALDGPHATWNAAILVFAYPESYVRPISAHHRYRPQPIRT
jgi:hypothetical protein